MLSMGCCTGGMVRIGDVVACVCCALGVDVQDRCCALGVGVHGRKLRNEEWCMGGILLLQHGYMSATQVHFASDLIRSLQDQTKIYLFRNPVSHSQPDQNP